MNQIDEQSADIIWPIIFKNLSIKDLFNCRLVNKQFKFCAAKSVHKLLAYDYDNFFIFDKKFWFHNNQVIDDDYSISQKCFQTIRKSSIFKLNNSLKYLTIKFDFKNLNFKEELSNLNDLINLECLELCFEIYFESIEQEDYELKLNLNNLKYLKIGSEYENIHYKLNTPKLEKISLYSMDQIQFESNPKSIKHLITQEYEDKIKIFKNLEIIEIHSGSNLDINLLSFFKNLKKLRFEIDYEFCGLNEIFEEKIAQILNKRKKLNRNIDIYLVGIKLMDIDKLKEIRSDDRTITHYLLSNYDLLDFTKLNYLYHYYLNYYFDLTDLRNDIPSSFFDKFLYISKINLTGIAIEDNDLNSFMDNMNWFLNNLKCLVDIQMESGFIQNFFDNLPISIRQLSIFDEESSYSNINFNFIFKLTKLIVFIIHCNVDLFDTTLAFISNSTNPVNFFFKFRDKDIRLIRLKGCFKLIVENPNDYKKEIYFECSNYNKFVDEFKKIESKLKF